MRWTRLRPKPRWIFAAIACVVLLAGAVSRWHDVWWESGSGRLTVILTRGQIWVQRTQDDTGAPRGLWWPRGGWRAEPSLSWGISYRSWTPGQFIAIVPLWLPFVIASSPALLLWWIDARRTRREKLGLCRCCRYDRRGLAADAKCPECGTIPATPSK